MAKGTQTQCVDAQNDFMAKDGLSIHTSGKRRLKKPVALPEKKVCVQQEICHAAKSELMMFLILILHCQTFIVQRRQDQGRTSGRALARYLT